MSINQELTDLQNTFTKLKSDLASSKYINAKTFRLRGNVGQTNNIPGGNAWKFRAFLIAFPTMILRVRFVAFFVNAMLILTLSS